MFIIVVFIVFIWSFRLVSWREMHEQHDEWYCHWDGVPYSDKTPLDTFIRRFYYLIDIDEDK